jgi:hypothetical protein
MLGIGFGFINRRDRILLRHLAVTQTRNLQEYVPNPVTGFPAAFEFLDNAQINAILRFNETG